MCKYKMYVTTKVIYTPKNKIPYADCVLVRLGRRIIFVGGKNLRKFYYVGKTKLLVQSIIIKKPCCTTIKQRAFKLRVWCCHSIRHTLQGETHHDIKHITMVTHILLYNNLSLPIADRHQSIVNSHHLHTCTEQFSTAGIVIWCTDSHRHDVVYW